MSLTDGVEEITSINVFNMFRDNEIYLTNFYIPTMIKIEEKYPSCKFIYYITENDSKDDTAIVLLKFIKTRNPQSKLFLDPSLSAEYVNMPSGKNYTRLRTLSEIRNSLVERARPLEGKWSVFIDSNIMFTDNIFEELFKIQPALNNICMMCPFTQQLIIPEIHKIPTLTKPSLIGHYYDTFAFYNDQHQCYWPYCGFERCAICKNINYKNRSMVPKEPVTDATSVFSGFAIMETNILNDPRIYWHTVNYDMAKDEGLCEHVLFCDKVRTVTGKRIVLVQEANRIYRTY